MEVHQIYLDIAVNVSKLSKCEKVHVGCIIVKEGRIITTGVNGTPKGHMNCCDKFSREKNLDELIKDHSQWSLKHEIHAEMNAIMFATRNGTQIPEGSILYCTHEPCDNCLKHIVALGIREVYFINKYHNNITKNTFGIKIIQVKNE